MKDLAELPFSYTRGDNPYTDKAMYYCGDCGLHLDGDEVGYVGAGVNYANGEHSPCPACGEEHAVFRGEEDPESLPKRQGIYTNAKPDSDVRRLRLVKTILKIISELTLTSLTIPELADKLQVSNRTIRRNLNVLMAELVIFKDEENGTYFRNPNW